MSERNENRPWGSTTHGDARMPGFEGKPGAGAGASLAGTPAEPAQSAENAEAQTSGLTPPEGTADHTASANDPPRGPGAFAADVDSPPVFDL